MHKIIGSFVAAVMVVGAVLVAQDGPLTNAANILVRTDGGYLLVAEQTYTGPDGPLRAFANTPVRTDASGYLIVTNPTPFGPLDISGTPANNQIVVWVDADTIEGDTDFLWDGTNTLTLGLDGVSLTDDNDGAITFLGLGNGNDEDLTLNLDDTADTGTFTSSTSLATLNFSGIALQESGIAVLNNDEIDASSELSAIMDDETGTGLLTFATAPTFTTSIAVGSAGMLLSDDGDGALTFLGQGDGSDEDLTLNLDDTANTGTFTSLTGLVTLNFSSIALQESGAEIPDITGTPGNDQLGIWTDADTLEGDSNITWDGTTFTLNTAGDPALRADTGTVIFDERLILGVAGVLNGIVTTADSLVYQIDSDNDNSNDSFQLRKDGVGVSDGTLLFSLSEGGAFNLNDDANANLTVGLTINQGVNDNQLFTLKSSDIAHGRTTIGFGGPSETDDIFGLAKISGDIGGVLMNAFGETGLNEIFALTTYGGAPTTDDTSASVAPIMFAAGEHDGSNGLNDMAADSNLFAVAEMNSSGIRLVRLLLKADDGELHLGNATLGPALDAYDDAMAIRGLQQLHSGGEGIIPTLYDRDAYTYDQLYGMGVVGARDAEEFFLFSVQRYFDLHDGAIFQNFVYGQDTRRIVNTRTARLENELRTVRAELAMLKGQFDEMAIPRRVAAAGVQ